MRKIDLKFLGLAAALASFAQAPARAQQLVETTVLTTPTGPWFTVDGTTLSQPFSAFWPIGSQHTIGIPQGSGVSYGGTTIQWQFTGWEWDGGSTTNANMTVVATPSITRYTAQFAVSYALTVNLSCADVPCSSPGAVIVNGSAQTGSSWQPSGSLMTLVATPAPGFLFSGWQVGSAPLVAGISDSVTMSGPVTVTAVFIPTKTVNFATSPSSLEMYVDGTLLVTPTTLQWGLGTSHTLSALPIEVDSQGIRWVYSSWSDGGAQTHTYTVGTNSNPETVTAIYAAAAYPIFATIPTGLNLVVDGIAVPPPYSYIWGIGSTHTISAPSPQTDSQGNVWAFQQWNDGVTAQTRTVTIPVNSEDNLAAIYVQQVKVTVNSSIAGQVVTVNANSCTTPCTVGVASGSQVHVSAPASVTVSSQSRQQFLGWSLNGGAPAAGDWIGTVNAATALTAQYQLMNQLSTSAAPSLAATWTISPTSPDGFYDSQTTVTVAVAPRPGYRFEGWSGALSGTSPSGSLNMSAPRQVMAKFNHATPSIPTGVRGGGGQAPRLVAAAGSVASIAGTNFTTLTESSPASPLARSLAGVTVRIGAHELSLYYASPSQISVQIPPDLEPGVQTLTIRADGNPDVTAELTVVRNAPALFPAAEAQTDAMVVHENGSPVTMASPARAGELLTAYGTGFGPTGSLRPEGSAVPLKPALFILDPVQISVASSLLTSEASFAAPGQVGVDAVEFRLDSSVPSGAVPLTVTVNGAGSNTLTLWVR